MWRVTFLRVIPCEKEVWSSRGRFRYMCVRRRRFGTTAKFSRRGAVVIVEQAAQPLAAPDCSTLTSIPFIRHDQSVAETLVVSFAMIMRHELLNPFAQRALTEPRSCAPDRIP